MTARHVVYDGKTWQVTKETTLGGKRCYNIERRTAGRRELTFVLAASCREVKRVEDEFAKDRRKEAEAE